METMNSEKHLRYYRKTMLETVQPRLSDHVGAGEGAGREQA